MKVNILGTKYNIVYKNYECTDLKGSNRMAYCFFDEKLIVVGDLDTNEEWKLESEKAKSSRRKTILRHEIVHAYMYESGLAWSTAKSNAWAVNEEMIDWMAIQFPKMLETFRKADAM